MQWLWRCMCFSVIWWQSWSTEHVGTSLYNLMAKLLSWKQYSPWEPPPITPISYALEYIRAKSMAFLSVLREMRRLLEYPSHKNLISAILRIGARKSEESFLSGTPVARAPNLDLWWQAVLTWGLSSISWYLAMDAYFFLACENEHGLKISQRRK